MLQGEPLRNEVELARALLEENGASLLPNRNMPFDGKPADATIDDVLGYIQLVRHHIHQDLEAKRMLLNSHMQSSDTKVILSHHPLVALETTRQGIHHKFRVYLEVSQNGAIA